jgi:hypothetical protein
MKQLEIKYQLQNGNFYSLSFYLNQVYDGWTWFDDNGKLLKPIREVKKVIREVEGYKCTLKNIDIYDMVL